MKKDLSVKQRRWHGKQFIRTFFSYLLVLSVGMLIFSVLFVNDTLRKTEEEASLQQLETAENIASLIDQGLESIITLTGKMSRLHWVIKLQANVPSVNAEFDPLSRMYIVNDMRTYLSGNAFFNSALIVFPQQESVISHNGWFTLEDYLSFLGENPLADRLPQTICLPHNYDILDADALEEDALWDIWIIKTLDHAAEPRAQILFRVGRAELRRYLLQVFPGSLCRLDIRDAEGNLLISVNKTEQNADPSRLNEVKLDSGLLGWQYDLYFNDSALTISAGSFYPLAISLLICCLIQPVLAYLLAAVSYRPLQKLLQKLQEDGRGDPERLVPGGVSEYLAIEQHIDSLSVDNRQLRQRMEEYQESVQKDVLRQLLQGCFDRESLSKMMEAFPAALTDEMVFGVIIVSFSAPERGKAGEPEQEDLFGRRVASILYVEQKLKQCAWPFYLLPSYEAGMVAILYDGSGRLDDAGLEHTAWELEKDGNRTPHFLQSFTGRAEKGIIGISKSYQIAKEKYSYSIFSQRMYQTQEQAADTAFYYPTDWEVQLINSLKTAQLESTRRILNEIREENRRRELSPAAYDALFHFLRSTLRRVASELNITDFQNSVQSYLSDRSLPEPPTEVAASRAVWEQWRWLEAGCQVICGRRSYNRTEPSDIGTQLVEYVNLHFDDPSISLKELALRFSVSTSTVSAAFKPVVNLNFYDYVSRLRMEKAKELLRKSELSIREICRMVGYENEYSFRRAYLRYEGITPSEYRNNAKMECGAKPV
ncbi:MAG: AraC family transcriptional regulator [Eubacteriales bacterium]|nr:AraC family transcriptional regulator [Eubacteriales bacterium]